MPILTFDVETYTVLTTQSGTTSNGAWRNISLTSTSLAHGIRSRASVFFFETTTSMGIVTNVDQPNFNGLTVYANCKKADFADWYDMLRNEKPMKFGCAYEGPDFDPNKPSRVLYWVQLYTGQQEPPGEGPEGVQAMLFTTEMLDVIRKSKSKN